MSEPTPLAWGKSPFDHLDHAALLREAQRMYAAITAAYGVLHLQRGVDLHHDPNNLFWGDDGFGGNAYGRCHAIIEATEARFDGEDIYHSFFRYTKALLFPELPVRRWEAWCICPNCEWMQAGESDMSGQPCTHCATGGVLRPITWDDIRPKEEAPHA